MMDIRELIFLPTGDVLTDANIDSSGEELREWTSWWSGRRSPAEIAVETSLGALSAKMTFAESGQALATWMFQAQPVLSSVVGSGQRPTADAELLEMFLGSMRRTKHVKELSADPSPFEALRQLNGIPFIGGVFWPTLSPSMFLDSLLPIASFVMAGYVEVTCGGNCAAE